MLDEYKLAVDRISKHCGVKFRYIGNHKTCDIIIDTFTQGPGGVLAKAELPCAGVRQYRQWYDNKETWTFEDSPGGGRYTISNR